MAVLTYGNVTLQVLKTHHIGSEDEYDPTGLDYLWTRYTFDVTGLVNLANTSYTTQQGNPQPVSQTGQSPFLTIQAIRDTLSLPRQPLTYTDEQGNLMVQSPPLGPVPVANFQPGGGIQNNIIQPPQQLDCDCDGGPTPLRPIEVLSVHGAGHSVIVRFAVSTTLNDSIFWTAQGGLAVPLVGGGIGGAGKLNFGKGFVNPKPPILLSNRWTTTEILDENAFSTRVFTGRAVFRADLLRAITVSPADGSNPHLAVPDDFRKYWANFYIPNGFQRKNVRVDQEPDGFAVRYQVTDVQLPVTLLQGQSPGGGNAGWPASKIEAIATFGMDSVGAEQIAEEIADDVVMFAIAALENTAHAAEIAGLNPVVPASAAGAAAGAGFRALALGARIGRQAVVRAAEILPRSTDAFVITVWGQPGSTRQALANVAYTVLFNYISAADSFFSTTSARLTADLMGKWVQLTATVKRGPVASAVVAGLNVAAIDMRARIPADDGIKNITTTTAGQQPPFPYALGTRGTALEMLVAQTLMYPYTEAPGPPGHSTAGGGAVLP